MGKRNDLTIAEKQKITKLLCGGMSSLDISKGALQTSSNDKEGC